QFLNFSQIPNYHPNGFFKSIDPAIPNKPLEPGVKMHNILEGMTINPTLLVRLSLFCSGLFGMFNGVHIFRFEKGTKTQGGTTFVHEEKFTGLLTFTMGDGFVARSIGLKESTKSGFERYNQDLKAWCE
ncbi:hypothetical protein AOQ84DRAFT_274154, partial [Glonium stellatum]